MVDLRKALAETEQQIAEAPEASLNNPLLKADLDQVEQELRMMGVPVDEPKRSSFQGIREWITRFLNVLTQWFVPSGNVSAQSSEGNTVVFSLSYASRMAISFAVAASLAIAIILPHKASLASSGFTYAPSQLGFETLRGDASVLFEKSVHSYNAGDYDSALSYLEESKKGIEASLSQLGDIDSDIIVKQNLTKELYQVDWYRTLTLMKVKNVKEAKHALRNIAKSDSPYKEEASKVLRDIY